MILIDRLVSLTAHEAIAETTLPCKVLTEKCEGGNAAWALEIAAQTCAAWIGWSQQEKGYREGRLIKSTHWRLLAKNLPASGMLHIRATLEAASDMGVFLFQAALKCDEQTVAEGQLTILAR